MGIEGRSPGRMAFSRDIDITASIDGNVTTGIIKT